MCSSMDLIWPMGQQLSSPALNPSHKAPGIYHVWKYFGETTTHKDGVHDFMNIRALLKFIVFIVLFLNMLMVFRY